MTNAPSRQRNMVSLFQTDFLSVEVLVPGRLRCGAGLLCVFVLTLISTNCGSVGAAPFSGSNGISAVSVSVSPTNAAVVTGAIQPFTATVNNTGLQSVSWLVNGFPGGNASFGTIDGNGNYTAPLYVPNPNVVTVTAAANADNTAQASARVTLSGTPMPVTVKASATNLYVGDITLVTASVTLPNKAVTWEVENVPGGNATFGTITVVPGNEDEAIYVAPLSVPGSTNQIPITAVSQEDPTKFGSVVVTLSNPPANSPSVSISPNNLTGIAVPAGFTQNFQATVTHSNDTSVTWFVDGISGGNSTIGTISPKANDSAVYTAPSLVPVPNQVYVTAVSNAQPAAQASTLVTITPTPKLTVTVALADVCQNAQSVPPGAQVQLNATVSGSNNQAVTWEVNQVAGGSSTYGTITQNGLYTAPASVPSNSNVVIGAVSQVDHKTTGTLPLNLTSTAEVAVKISPTSATVQTSSGNAGVKGNEEHSHKNNNSHSDGLSSSQTFTSTVTYSGTDNIDGAVGWSLTNNGNDNGSFGTERQDGCVNTASYIAPATVPDPSTIQVIATSNQDSTKSAQANVTIVARPQYSVIVSPDTWTYQSGGTQNTQLFTAVVYDGNGSPDPNQNVNWGLSVKGTSCDPNICGTINPASGLGSLGTTYTAPQVVNQSVDVTLASTAQVDGSTQGTATIHLVNGLPTISIFPASADCPAGANDSDPCTPTGSPTVTFSVSLQNLPGATVSWNLGCISWNNTHDICFSSEGFNGDYDGPGCTTLTGNKQTCGEHAYQGADPSATLNYLPPQNLETGNYTQNACSTDDGVNGYVQVLASVDQSYCSSGGTCSTYACIKVCPSTGCTQ